MATLANQTHTATEREDQSASAPSGLTGLTNLNDKLKLGCAVVALLLPIKLSLTYITLTPLILTWLYYKRASLKSHLLSKDARAIYAPLAFFLITALVSSLAGLAPLRSLASLSSLVFFSLTIPLFATQAAPYQTALALIAGQTMAALHTFIDASIPYPLPKLFLGKVTESSQLTLTIFIAIGAALALQPKTLSRSLSLRIIGASILTTLTLSLLGFQIEANLSSLSIICLAITALISCAVSYKAILQTPRQSRTALLIALCCLPLLISALILNLKRGPWLGVLIGASILCLWYARRFIAPIVIGALVLATTVAPIRERIADSYDHFTITGGRSTIWRIGLELATDYPLGIGYHNSGVLRNFAPEIPPELKHFHNNLINIAAETGWLGLGVFIWLCLNIVRLAWRDRSDRLAVAIGCGVISWQAAGLVEYNFGDSEVTILVWILLGLLLKLSSSHHDRSPA
ncbi:MAG: O-antigen ligase family protein [Pseudomonadota bacterium]